MSFAVRKPYFLEAPAFWPTRTADIKAAVARLQGAEHRIVGRSAGGRDLYAFAYGPKEPPRRTAHTLSSALASGNPAAFWDPEAGRRPVVLVVAAIHGQEVEGIATCLNLLNVVETGVDLRGKAWPRLAELAALCRLVVVPLGNPDGRERIPIANLVGSDIDDVHYYGQGVTREGNILTWPECKQWQPMPLEMMQLLGAYYNDDGVNVQHDDFVANPAPETKALLALAADEVPDLAVSIHGCGYAPIFTGVEHFLPEPYQARQAHLEAVALHRLRQQGYPIAPPVVAFQRYFNFQTALYMASGCVPLGLELPHGMTLKPFTLDEILDMGLLVLEELLAFGAGFGFRPRSAM
jgi:hypothetical protein